MSNEAKYSRPRSRPNTWGRGRDQDQKLEVEAEAEAKFIEAEQINVLIELTYWFNNVFGPNK